MTFNNLFYKFNILLTRNKSGFKRNAINLLYFKEVKNLGDILSPLIVQYMLSRKNLSLESHTKHKYCKLSAVGSILSFYVCDRVVWGSGFKSPMTKWFNNKFIRIKFDVRCVRGPLSLNQITNLPSIKASIDTVVFGDPAILMPLIYNPKVKKRYDISIVCHFLDKNKINSNFNNIDIQTDDYKHFIDEICSSKLVISSSLHGIILAEAYGVHAVWLRGS